MVFWTVEEVTVEKKTCTVSIRNPSTYFRSSVSRARSFLCHALDNILTEFNILFPPIQKYSGHMLMLCATLNQNPQTHLFNNVSSSEDVPDVNMVADDFSIMFVHSDKQPAFQGDNLYA